MKRLQSMGVWENGSGKAAFTPILPHPHTPIQPFDALAADYDRTFTHTTIGRLMREAVWRRLDARFGPGDSVLELGCGTGEDAVYLGLRGVQVFATDVSPSMVETARRKVAEHGVAGRVTVQQMAIEGMCGSMRVREYGGTGGFSTPTRPHTHTPTQPFDGALSNFGGLNCAGDLRQVGEGLAACLRPGGIALLCVMGPLVPWEWGWQMGRGHPRKAFRRLRSGGAVWRGLTIHYPSIRAMRRAFAPEFRLVRASAVGALVPPPCAEVWASRYPRLVALLNRCERRLETVWPLPWLADHYLIELERV